MNKTEQRYAAQLDLEIARGEIATWWWEPVKLKLAPRTYYSPDFLVMRLDGTLEIHETKGHMEDDAAVKLKVTSDLYWCFPVKLVRWKRGAWHVALVERAGLPTP